MDNSALKTSSRPRGRFFLTKGDAARLAVSAIGFFIGRMVLFDTINPAAIGFLASFAGTGFSFYLTALFLTLGIVNNVANKIRGVYLIRYLVCICLLCVLNIAAEQVLARKKNLRVTVFAQGTAGALCMLIGGLSIVWLNGSAVTKLNLFLIIFLESILAFFSVFVLSKASAALIAPKRKSVLSNEEIISFAILFGCIIAGASDIHVGPVSLRYILCFYFIMLTAYQGDGAAAAAAGMLTGLLLLLSGAGRWNASMAVVLSLAGLSGGLFKSRGKPYVIAAFALGGGAAFYFLEPGLLNLEVLYSMSFAGLLFLITPWKFNFHITAQLNPVIDNPQEYISGIRSMAVEQMGAYSEAFARLSHKFGEMAAAQERLDKRDVVKIADSVASEACKSCKKQQACWEDNFYATYQYVFGLLDQCEKKGAASADEAAEEFKSQCVDPDHFISIVNSSFDLYKSNLAWKNSLIAGREMISQQLSGVSEVIKNLAGDMDSFLQFKDDLAEKIIQALVKGNIDAQRVTVTEDKAGRLTVNIKHQFHYDKKQWNRTVIHMLNSVLKRRMQTGEDEREQVYNTRFIEERTYNVTCGASGVSKGHTGESGDSHSFMDLQSGHMLLIVSDGMGSGKRARDESSAAVDLLENFLASGFEKLIAVKIINSVLTVSNRDENFATLDICTINLYTGDAEFVKLGAAPAFLLHEGKVSVIASSTLPIGMLKYVDMEVTRKKLSHGDILVMVTDGVVDASDKADKEDWIAGALSECQYANPQDIADYLLFEAQRLSDGEINDDMTVLAARVWEK